jgi:hypothetical protein
VREEGVCRERKGLEESKGKFTKKGVKQKEAENKTKQSPDSSPNSAYAFLFSSSRLFFFCLVLLLFPTFSIPSLPL